MANDQKGFSTIVFFTLAIVTLLSCCSPVSSFLVLPRVTHTSDAIIIDFNGVGHVSSFYQNKNVYGEIVNPAGFIPAPTFNPYGMVHPQQQQPMLYNGWPYSFGLPSLRQNITAATNQNNQCGRGPTTLHTHTHDRITGGNEAKPNSWPFLVTLQDFMGIQALGQSCSGTLISDSKVLLAAQCLERMPLLYLYLVTVSIGVHSLYPSDAQMTRRISKVVLHRQFNAVTYANDIAIITLDAPVTFSKSVAPVCLPAQSADPDQYADQEAAILGWGQSSVLQQGRATIASNYECKNKDNLSKFVTDTTMCLHSNRRFTCPGDIGGPVVVQTSPATWTLVGINSFTQDCESQGLKTRVSAFRTWIDQNVQN